MERTTAQTAGQPAGTGGSAPPSPTCTRTTAGTEAPPLPTPRATELPLTVIVFALFEGLAEALTQG